jgi:hypothetical protein
MAIRPALRGPSVWSATWLAVSRFADLQGQRSTINDRALEAAEKIDDGDFMQVWEYLWTLHSLLSDGPELTEEQGREKLHSCGSLHGVHY